MKYTNCIVNTFAGVSSYPTKVISKVWGKEEILTVDSFPYTIKKMTLKPEHKCSFHMHKEKIESFLLISGSLCLELIDSKTTKHEIIELTNPYETITLKEMTIHSFYTKDSNGCIFLECSTKDHPDDSYRFTKSK